MKWYNILGFVENNNGSLNIYFHCSPNDWINNVVIWAKNQFCIIWQRTSCIIWTAWKVKRISVRCNHSSIHMTHAAHITTKYTFHNFSNFYKIFNIVGLMAASFLKGCMAFDFLYISVCKRNFKMIMLLITLFKRSMLLITSAVWANTKDTGSI